MGRRGVSFTMTVVVVAVLLLGTALSILTLSGTSISGFFDQIRSERRETVRETTVRRECRELARRIDRQYCNQYVESCTDSSPQDLSRGNHNRTATAMGCDVTQGPVRDDLSIRVQGNVFDCGPGGKGYISDTCPAG
ncbi:MAG: hypothetical protein SVW77_03420 [Candidatus Nanohaloarchaea archaeon]|nr:hypothetical protein [Candidatus Nanohaloarchaea archaeon]